MNRKRTICWLCNLQDSRLAAASSQKNVKDSVLSEIVIKQSDQCEFKMQQFHCTMTMLIVTKLT